MASKNIGRNIATYCVISLANFFLFFCSTNIFIKIVLSVYIFIRLHELLTLLLLTLLTLLTILISPIILTLLTILTSLLTLLTIQSLLTLRLQALQILRILCLHSWLCNSYSRSFFFNFFQETSFSISFICIFGKRTDNNQEKLHFFVPV